MKKETFARRFRRRFLLRFHMSLILAATCLSGVLFSKLLLHLSVGDVLIRYPLVAGLSYLLFFLFVKLWLWYVSTAARQKVAKAADALINTADLTELPTDLPARAAAQVAEAFSGGGGDFGGGGASGSFAEAGEAVADLAGKAGKSVGDAVGDLIPDLDEGAGLALLALGALLAVVFGAGLYLVYSAPAILSEAAFEFLLAGSLIKRSKRVDDPDWVGSVLRATWVPFAVVFLIAVAAGWVMHSYYPELTRIADLFGR